MSDVDQMVKSTPVEVLVSSISTSGVGLKVRDIIDYTDLGDNLTLEEIFNRKDWRVAGTFYPLENEIPNVSVSNLRQMIEMLGAWSREIADMRERSSMVTWDNRHLREIMEESIRHMEMKVKVLKMMIEVSMKASLGCWPRELSYLI